MKSYRLTRSALHAIRTNKLEVAIHLNLNEKKVEQLLRNKKALTVKDVKVLGEVGELEVEQIITLK